MKEIMIPNGIKVTNQEIKFLEQKLLVKFTDEYKQFLRKFNGGKTIIQKLRINIVTASGFKTTAYLDKMFSINEIENYYNMIFSDDEGAIELHMAHCIVIGITNGGCAICLCVKGASKGKIYHYEGNFGLVYLADNLADFFNVLEESE